MSDDSTIELGDLVGEHKLSGVEYRAVTDEHPGSHRVLADILAFTLDGVTYEAVEDPADGYRSLLGEIRVSAILPAYRFPPQAVVAAMRAEGQGDILEIRDAVSGEMVLEVGTDETREYYPVCIMNYYPENMSINVP